jgi:hypothetical protein
MRNISRWTLVRDSADGSPSWQPEVGHTLLEMVWETVRLREYPDRPSRLGCLFLWMSEAEARAWHHRKHTLRASSGRLYEVDCYLTRRDFLNLNEKALAKLPQYVEKLLAAAGTDPGG